MPFETPPHFEPLFCPNRDCANHRTPGPRFWFRHGAYAPRCRDYAVPRMRCKSCGITFSRQTFRHDRGDRRPDANVALFGKLISGIGLRKAAKFVALDLRSVRGKLRKIGRTCARLHRHLCRQLPAGRAALRR